MKFWVKGGTIGVMCILFWSITGIQALAQQVENGSVSGSPAVNGIFNGNAPPWSVCAFTPDLCDVGLPSFAGTAGVAPVASPDGGTWVSIASLGECAQTLLTGMTAGQNYTLYFCAANFGTDTIFNGVSARPEISLGGTTQSFFVPQTPGTWFPFSMNFTATGAFMILSATHPLSNDSSYVSLDGFNLTGNICNPTPMDASSAQLFARSEACRNELTWELAADHDVELLQLERRVEGESYEMLEEMVPQVSGMTSTTDYWPVERAEYRLRIERQDGQVEFSEAISVTCDCDRPYVQIAPHPVPRGQNTQLRLYTQTTRDQLRVYDLQGRLLLALDPDSQARTWQALELPTRNWPAGMYFIHTSHGQIQKLLITD